MTQIEQIKAEIERRMKNNQQDATESGAGAFYEDRQLLSFINSLPAEQQSEELKEEIKKYFANVDLKEVTFSDIARHFAQWQKEQMMKSAIDATCVLLPPPDLFKVLICHDVTDKLSKGEKVKIITVTVKEDKQ